jgi:carbonic anhydrase
MRLDVMLPRRQVLVGSALGIAGAALPMLRPKGSKASGVMDHQLLESLQVCTPKDALTRLKEGNARFAKAWTSASAAGTPEQRMHQLNTIWEQNCQIDPIALAKGQKPFAAILSCADSRVDPGWLFACGSGELFQVRSAGNTAFDEAIASLEYAVSVLGTSLVVVMGHSACGAVKAALASEPLTPLLEGLVKPIRASLRSGDNLPQAIEGKMPAMPPPSSPPAAPC